MSANKELQLKRKLHNPDNKVVVQAIEELRANGWLEDGSLRGASLRHVHFQGVDLYEANLQKVDLRMAHLQLANLCKADLEGARLSSANLYGADLSGANLRDANLFKVNLQSVHGLTDSQLEKANCLWGAIMPDGSIYDGHFNLPGDLEFAKVGQIDIEDHRAMADFYAASESQVSLRTEEITTTFPSLTLVQLIRKLLSSDNEVVKQTVDELRARGHLSDGSLEWVYLSYVHMQGADLSGAILNRANLNMAHLQGADLSGANLHGTRMTKANLRGAKLAGANLQDAFMAWVNLQGILDVTEEQLVQASRLRGATMPDGRCYDGRFNLVGDLGDARFLRVDIHDSAAISQFYGISVEEYELGQEWVREHMPLVWSDVFASPETMHVECDLDSLIGQDSETTN